MWVGSGGGGGCGKTVQWYEIDKLSRHKHTRAHTLPHTRTNQTMNNSLVRTSYQSQTSFTSQEAPTSVIVANNAEPCAIHLFVYPRRPLALL